MRLENNGIGLAELDTTSPVAPPIVILTADDVLGTAFSTSHAERLTRHHPDVEIIRIPGAGHGIHDERRHRELFSEHLNRFLARHTCRAIAAPACRQPEPAGTIVIRPRRCRRNIQAATETAADTTVRADR